MSLLTMDLFLTKATNCKNETPLGQSSCSYSSCLMQINWMESSANKNNYLVGDMMGKERERQDGMCVFNLLTQNNKWLVIVWRNYDCFEEKQKKLLLIWTCWEIKFKVSSLFLTANLTEKTTTQQFPSEICKKDNWLSKPATARPTLSHF